MDKDKEPKRAVIEYWEYPWVGEGQPSKKRTMSRVIESAVDSADAEKQFWRNPVWPSGIKAISIQKTTLDD